MQSAADREELARKERFCKIEDCRIGIGAANGFLQAREQIVVRVVAKIANRCVKAIYVLAQNFLICGMISVFKQNDGVAHVTASRVTDIIANFI